MTTINFGDQIHAGVKYVSHGTIEAQYVAIFKAVFILVVGLIARAKEKQKTVEAIFRLQAKDFGPGAVAGL